MFAFEIIEDFQLLNQINIVICRHDAQHAANGLYELCFLKMKQWVSNYQEASKNTTVKIELWIGDALYVSVYALPEDYSFDVINTSNLIDHLGVLNLLLACKQRLKE